MNTLVGQVLCSSGEDKLTLMADWWFFLLLHISLSLSLSPSLSLSLTHTHTHTHTQSVGWACFSLGEIREVKYMHVYVVGGGGVYSPKLKLEVSI